MDARYGPKQRQNDEFQHHQGRHNAGADSGEEDGEVEGQVLQVTPPGYGCTGKSYVIARHPGLSPNKNEHNRRISGCGQLVREFLVDVCLRVLCEFNLNLATLGAGAFLWRPTTLGRECRAMSDNGVDL